VKWGNVVVRIRKWVREKGKRGRQGRWYRFSQGVEWSLLLHTAIGFSTKENININLEYYFF
jgi:hypothetical protein